MAGDEDDMAGRFTGGCQFITPDLAARFVGYQHPDNDT
jgi:hypothetical protein